MRCAWLWSQPVGLEKDGAGLEAGEGVRLSESCPKEQEKSVTSLYCMLEANLL